MVSAIIRSVDVRYLPDTDRIRFTVTTEQRGAPITSVSVGLAGGPMYQDSYPDEVTGQWIIEDDYREVSGLSISSINVAVSPNDKTIYSRVGPGGPYSGLPIHEVDFTGNIDKSYVINPGVDNRVYGVGPDRPDPVTKTLSSGDPNWGHLGMDIFMVATTNNDWTTTLNGFSAAEGDLIGLLPSVAQGINSIKFKKVTTEKKLSKAYRKSANVIHYQPKGEKADYFYLDTNGSSKGYGSGGGLMFAFTENSNAGQNPSTATGMSADSFFIA